MAPETIDERLQAGELIEDILAAPGFARQRAEKAATRQSRAAMADLRGRLLLDHPEWTAAEAQQAVLDAVSKNALAEATLDAAEAKAAWDAANSPDALWRRANTPEALAAKAAQDARVRAAVVEQQRRDLAKAPNLVDQSMPDVSGGYGGKDRR